MLPDPRPYFAGLDGKTLRGIRKRLLTRLVAVKTDYVLALKDNHPQLYDDVSLWLNTEADRSRSLFMKR